METYTESSLDEILRKAADDKGCLTTDIRYHVMEEKKDEDGNTTEVTAEVYTSDDIKEFLFDYLGNFFTSIDEEIEVAIEETEDNGFIVNLNAENNAVLIGKMGKTIDAFNTVVRGAVNAEFRNRVNVLIDVNHYKEERYSRLRSMAKRLGRQVQKTHVDVELDPMPNDERKVIHQQLNEWHNLRTESEGEGSRRHVCIRYVENPEPAAEDTAE
jgi:spoIIIJ-associated protein